MNLIFLGPPGSGKGTQALRVAEKFGLVHLSTGDLLRAAVKAHTEIGQQAEQYMSKGDLVPDGLIIGLIEEKIANGELSNGFILDGFPRTIPQAESLKAALARNGMSVDHAVLLNVSDEMIIGRLARRSDIEGRSDDNEGIVKNRLAVYKRQTEPIIGFYRKESVVREIDGETTPDEVFERIVANLSH